eukprot:CAMPEP_0204128000 /NCGR_PEP_ID=MMETSP0361-20130328/11924_1 /ASSEMBLY_ACC=CAM_ASM_000343 /TAXON_ID=268821 /ORGANISM="Scrippsiella Hangoei, Strain SHTV-5" /LENGTH=139 /DNA_ID=CAMNT_0051080151 /DNA_START=86 /DNA_END=501 /DNA_ORIENTATION=+
MSSASSAVEGISSLLRAAAGLSDVELAVALQGLLSRRPAAREVLARVWRAEELTSLSPLRLEPASAPFGCLPSSYSDLSAAAASASRANGAAVGAAFGAVGRGWSCDGPMPRTSEPEPEAHACSEPPTPSPPPEEFAAA